MYNLKSFKKPTLAEDLYFINEYRKKKEDQKKAQTKETRENSEKPQAQVLQAG